jgi:hypothetical protein
LIEGEFILRYETEHAMTACPQAKGQGPAEERAESQASPIASASAVE